MRGFISVLLLGISISACSDRPTLLEPSDIPESNKTSLIRLNKTAAPVAVQIRRNAVVLPGGKTAKLWVRVSCDPAFGEILEAFAYIVQDDHQSFFAPVGVSCTATPHVSEVVVPADPERTFTPGAAFSSAYILMHDESTGDTTSGQDAREIVLH